MATTKSVRDWARAIREHSGLNVSQMIQAGQHGADAGWAGFTYTDDAVEFFDRHAPEIWALATEEAESMGQKNACEMIAGFGRADMVEDWDTFRNLLAWYVLEHVGRELESDAEAAHAMRGEFADAEDPAGEAPAEV